MTMPMLEIFDDSHDTQHKVYIYASAKVLGAVLLQKCTTEVSFNPVVYFSRKLNHAYSNYSVTDKKMLSIVETLKHFHPYLHGTKFIIRTNY